METHDKKHTTQGFTGSATDENPRSVYYQAAVVDVSGRVYRMYPRISFRMRQLQGPMHATRGNIDMRHARYSMDMEPRHRFRVPVKDPEAEGAAVVEKEIEVSSFIPRGVHTTGGKWCHASAADPGLSSTGSKDTAAEKHRYEVIRPGEVRELRLPTPYPCGQQISIFLAGRQRQNFTLSFPNETYPRPIFVNVTPSYEVTLWVRTSGASAKKIRVDQKGRALLETLMLPMGLGTKTADSIFGDVGPGFTPAVNKNETVNTETDAALLDGPLGRCFTEDVAVGKKSKVTNPTTYTHYNLQATFNKTLPMATDDSMIALAQEAEKKYQQKKRTITEGSTAWKLFLVHAQLRNWDVSLFDEDAAILTRYLDAGEAQVTAEEVALILEVMICLCDPRAFTVEGNKHRFFLGYVLGCESIRYERSPLPSIKVKQLHHAEKTIQTLLMTRETSTEKCREFVLAVDK
ncbi:unnamed protein product, partial [Amoebophrya sp. A25]|eukprot:GSA25T00027947001.1